VFLVTGSDAPLYHFPITTLSLIGINVLIHLGVSAVDPHVIMPWCLEYGNGLHPLQWISCNFLHAGWVHLIGNMLFLWPFGLLVEGKLGWWRMLLLCLAICVLHASVQQVLMLRANYGDDAAHLSQQFEGNEEWEAMSQEEKDEVVESLRQGLLENGYGRSLGASCLVFGLLAICAIWAPVNEFDVISRWGSYEWPVLTVAAVFIVKEIIGAFLVGGAISTPMLHMFGAVAGLVIGLGMLTLGMVDCEGFDLISHVTGEKFQPWTISELVPARKRQEEQKAAAVEAAKAAAEAERLRPKWKVATPQIESAATLGAAAMHAAPIVPIPTRAVSHASKPIGPDPLFAPAPSPAVPANPSSTPDSFPLAITSGEAGAGGDQWLDDLELPDPPTPEELIESAIECGDFSTAMNQLSATLRADKSFKPSATTIHRLGDGLIKSQRVEAALKVLAFGINRYPQHADRWRLRSAYVSLELGKDPAAAKAMLQSIDASKLQEQDRQRADLMMRRANGALERRDSGGGAAKP
jgi:membrane associated rhomboid family serine protease